MGISKNLKNYLKEKEIVFETISHGEAYAASNIARIQHIPGEQLLKSIIIKTDVGFILCVVAATQTVDIEKLKIFLCLTNLELAKESEFAKLFPYDEIGAEPPIGDLYGMSTYVDQTIKLNEFVFFNSGTHTDLIKMKTKDYFQLVNPVFGEFGSSL